MSNGSDAAGEKRVTNLAAIVGRWKIEDGRAVCEGPERPEWPYGLCVSNVRFLEGEARVTIRRTNGAGLIDGRIVFGYRSEKHEAKPIKLCNLILQLDGMRSRRLA
jgi:hypothetical protein